MLAIALGASEDGDADELPVEGGYAPMDAPLAYPEPFTAYAAPSAHATVDGLQDKV